MEISKKPLVTIATSMYNVEQYVSQNIESLIAQSYKNLEIIIVDDGSPDNSGKIADEYAMKDPRIKVIHQHNKGLGGGVMLQLTLLLVIILLLLTLMIPFVLTL